MPNAVALDLSMQYQYLSNLDIQDNSSNHLRQHIHDFFFQTFYIGFNLG